MKATSTASENERRPEVMRSLCSFYANDLLWVLIFEEAQFSYNQTTQPPRKIKKMAISLSFHKKEPFFCTIFKRRFYSSNIFVSGSDPISVSCVFGNLNCSPKMDDFPSFCRTKGLPIGHFCQFLQCHFLIVFVCLFVVVVFLHRIRPHVALLVDGVEHQADVIIAVFNPTPDKFRPEFFSAVQIYDFTIYCKSALK